MNKYEKWRERQDFEVIKQTIADYREQFANDPRFPPVESTVIYRMYERLEKKYAAPPTR